MKSLIRTLGAAAVAGGLYVVGIAVVLLLMFAVSLIAFFSTGGTLRIEPGQYFGGQLLLLVPGLFAGMMLRRLRPLPHPAILATGTGLGALATLGFFAITGSRVETDQFWLYPMAAALMALVGYGLMALTEKRKVLAVA